MNSNCHLEAWRRFRRGEAVHLCVRATTYSVAEKLFAKPWMLPVRWVGVVLQWLAWPATHLGELLRTGRWYHVTWIDQLGRHWEFAKLGPAGELDLTTRDWLPPLLFRGRVQRVALADAADPTITTE